MRIVLAADEYPRATTRAVEVSKGMPLHEALAVIVRSTTVSLLDQENNLEAAIKEKTAIEADEKNDSRAGSPDAVVASVGVKSDAADKWDGGLFGDGGVALDFFARDARPTPGMSLGAGWRITRQFEIYMVAILFLSSEASLNDTRLTLKRFPVSLAAGYMKRLGHLMLGGGGGMRLDIVREKLSNENSEITLEPDGVESHVSAFLYLRTGWWINRFLCFHIDLGAAFQLTRKHYGIATPDGNQVLIDPRPVQPSILIGFQLHFF